MKTQIFIKFIKYKDGNSKIYNNFDFINHLVRGIVPKYLKYFSTKKGDVKKKDNKFNNIKCYFKI